MTIVLIGDNPDREGIFYCIKTLSDDTNFHGNCLTRILHEFESFICKAFRDAVVLMLPQVPDNEANGRLGLARRVKTFMLFCQNHPRTKCYR